MSEQHRDSRVARLTAASAGQSRGRARTITGPLTQEEGCRGLMGMASGWQSFDRQFEPYLRAFMGPLWPGMPFSVEQMVEYIAACRILIYTQEEHTIRFTSWKACSVPNPAAVIRPIMMPL